MCAIKFFNNHSHNPLGDYEKSKKSVANYKFHIFFKKFIMMSITSHGRIARAIQIL